MSTPSLTQRLLRAARRGQEIVVKLPGDAPVSVAHNPRTETDPSPWVCRREHGAVLRFRASECYARLSLPLPSGTVLQHTADLRRCLFAGPGESDDFVRVVLAGDYMEVSRNLLRVV